jgi:hypothetical protein
MKLRGEFDGDRLLELGSVSIDGLMVMILEDY